VPILLGAASEAQHLLRYVHIVQVQQVTARTLCNAYFNKSYHKIGYV